MTRKSVYRGCLNKRRMTDADEAAERARVKMLKGAPPLRAYRCNVCKGWHLTKRVPANVT